MSTVASSPQSMSPPSPLQTLIRAAQAEDEVAMRQLVEMHVDFVRRFLSQFVTDPVQVDDLCQDTFISMFRSLPTYRAESKFSTWLLGISRNLALTHLRNQGRRRRREGEAMAALVHQWQIEQLESDSPEAESENKLASLQQCLAGLAPTARELVQRYYFEDVSAEEIAEQSGRKSGSVRMTLLRIRKRLRECVENKMREGSHE